MTKVLVTGGAGFIGSHLTEALVENGYEVTVLDNFSTGKKENLERVFPDIKVLRGDLRDKAFVKKAVKDKFFVFHLAAMASVPECEKDYEAARKINAEGATEVFMAASDAGVKRAIFASTAAVYGNDPRLPKKEEYAVDLPEGAYARTKMVGERTADEYCRTGNFETVVLRFFNVYGQRQNPNSSYSGVITKFAHALNNGHQPIITGDGAQTRDFVHVSDIVQGCISAMSVDTKAGRKFNLGTGTQTSVRDIYMTMCSILNKDVVPRFVPRNPTEVLHSVADISAARKIMGYEPKVSLREGLEQLLQNGQ